MLDNLYHHFCRTIAQSICPLVLTIITVFLVVVLMTFNVDVVIILHNNSKYYFSSEHQVLRVSDLVWGFEIFSLKCVLSKVVYFCRCFCLKSREIERKLEKCFWENYNLVLAICGHIHMHPIPSIHSIDPYMHLRSNQHQWQKIKKIFNFQHHKPWNQKICSTVWGRVRGLVLYSIAFHLNEHLN